MTNEANHMPIQRIRVSARTMRRLRIATAAANIARFFLALFDHWQCHVHV